MRGEEWRAYLSAVRAEAGRKGGLARHARHPEQSAQAVAKGHEKSHARGQRMSHKIPPDSLPTGQISVEQLEAKPWNNWKQNQESLEAKSGITGSKIRGTDSLVTPPAIKNPPQETERVPSLPFLELQDFLPQVDSVKDSPLQTLSENCGQNYTAQNVIQIWFDLHRANFEEDPKLGGRELGAAKAIAKEALLTLPELKAALAVLWQDDWYKKNIRTLGACKGRLPDMHKLARQQRREFGHQSSAEWAAELGLTVITGGGA